SSSQRVSPGKVSTKVVSNEGIPGGRIERHLGVGGWDANLYTAARVYPKDSRTGTIPPGVIVTGRLPVNAVQIRCGEGPNIVEVEQKVCQDIVGRNEYIIRCGIEAAAVVRGLNLIIIECARRESCQQGGMVGDQGGRQNRGGAEIGGQAILHLACGRPQR